MNFPLTPIAYYKIAHIRKKSILIKNSRKMKFQRLKRFRRTLFLKFEYHGLIIGGDSNSTIFLK
jgi:hypothetical protein